MGKSINQSKKAACSNTSPNPCKDIHIDIEFEHEHDGAALANAFHFHQSGRVDGGPRLPLDDQFGGPSRATTADAAATISEEAASSSSSSLGRALILTGSAGGGVGDVGAGLVRVPEQRGVVDAPGQTNQRNSERQRPPAIQIHSNSMGSDSYPNLHSPAEAGLQHAAPPYRTSERQAGGHGANGAPLYQAPIQLAGDESGPRSGHARGGGRELQSPGDEREALTGGEDDTEMSSPAASRRWNNGGKSGPPAPSGVGNASPASSASPDEDHDGMREPVSELTQQGSLARPAKFDFSKDLYPCSIVWCSICGLTWLCPVIGHMGIADEKGEVWEFLGFGATSAGGLAFGPVLRYVPLSPDPASGNRLSWNEALALGNRQCRGRTHKGCVDNCHTYVADVLNNMRYGKFSHWNSVVLALWVFFAGRYTSFSAVLLHWVPSLVIFGLLYWQFAWKA